MRTWQSLALGCALVTLIVGGLILDEAVAKSPAFCGSPTVGCLSIDCVPIAGACPQGGQPYTHSSQRAYTYTPCDANLGILCPSPEIFRLTCVTSRRVLDAFGDCITVCASYFTDPGC